MGYPQPTSFTAKRHVCLGGALARPCTISMAKSPAPEPHCFAQSMALSKGMEEKDNPALVFSGETKDWPSFKDSIQIRADKHDTT